MNEPLRKCPTCLTPVSEVKLGLRDFQWVTPRLPGKVAPMDIDFALEKNSRFLFLEFKPDNAGLAMGARISYKSLVRAGHEVWVVKGDGPVVQVSRMDRFGNTDFWSTMNIESLAEATVKWYNEMDKEKA